MRATAPPASAVSFRPFVGVLLLLLLLAAACTLDGRRDGSAASPYDVTIRRDTYSVPHIVAADFGSLGYGEGYAFAQDHACTVADQVLRARGERARYLGRGEQDVHLASDVVARAYSTEDEGRLSFEAAPPEVRAMVVGYADGYNRYLAETPVDRIPGWCGGQPWVRPIKRARSRTARKVSCRVRDGDRHRGAARGRATRRRVLVQSRG
jgi:acyl-homoserine-lactone acylase